MMNADEKTKIMEELSDIAISGLRKAVAGGRKPTRESLMNFLEEMPEAINFIEKRLGGGDGKKVDPEEYERLKSQKEKLVRQLDNMEERFEKSEGLSKRIMVFLSEWLRTETTDDMDEPIIQFKDILKQRSDPELLEEAFNTLKTLSVHGDVRDGGQEGKPKKSLVTRLLSKESVADVQARYIEQFRATYRDIINELGLDLGANFLPKRLHLGKQIENALTFDDFTALRKDILDLLHAYIESVFNDREKTTEFIRDIGRKLVEVEKDLLRTFGLTEDIFTENSLFGDSLMEELSDLENTVGFSQKIEELKEVVTSKLTHIKSAVMKKNENDRSLKIHLDEDIHALKAEFEGMKKEALDARAQAENLEREIFMDSLTGALNRRAYEKRIKEEFDRYMRYKRTFSILLFDVDHFKKINDSYGHATGDTVLTEIIKRVTPLVRESDMLARFGGEEFVVILPETEKKGAGDVAEKLRKTVENIEFIHRNEQLRITISVGVAEIRPQDKSPIDLFNRMDTAMYEAKRSGRNKVVIR
ncbi:MAG: GGDEF domain-containing protein [Proteobacteria bacterium]|nr:GGDEF domain-containing protein [Pseudomonadota bacterium]